MAVRRAISAAAQQLADAGVASARTDAELLAAYAAGVDRGRLILLDRPDAGFFTAFQELVDARARRVPLQHLVGTAAFGPLTLEVGPGVFIPRPETEALLEWALANLKTAAPQDDPVIVDLCTGSGALAAALAHHHPEATVLAVDDSAEALHYARRNTAAYRIDLVQADVTAPGLLPELDGRVHLVVSNPPYIPDGAELEPEVAEHDPHHALFGGPDGMRVVAAVAEHAARWLRPGGLVGIEHDDTTSARTVEMLARTGLFEKIESRTDLTGRPRFVTAVRGQSRQGEQR